jgi:hypothetical protein
MNCHEVGEICSVSSRGGMGLTEQALVHAHVAQCTDCRKQPLQVETSLGPSNLTPWLARGRVRLSRLSPMVSARSVRAATSMTGSFRFVTASVAHRLIWLRPSLALAGRRAARAAIEAAGAGGAQALDSLTRLGVLVSNYLVASGQAAARMIEVAWAGVPRVADLATGVRWVRSSLISFMGSVEAAGRRIVASRVGATRILALLDQANGTAIDARRIVLTTSNRALSELGSRASALRRGKPALRICTGIAGLSVVVAAIVLLTPRQWTADVMDRKPSELAGPAPVASSAPAPLRPRSIEAQDEIPAPMRRPDRAFAQGRATASGPRPSTEASRNTEGSDPAIDWLLRGGSNRRHAESP